MSLVEQLHSARKERLARLSPAPRITPVVTFTIQPYPYDAGWGAMWFYDLIFPAELPRKRYQIKDIQSAVADHYKIDLEDMLSERRTMDVVRPRQIGMYLAKKLTRRSLPEIARMFKKRDHTTILHGVRKIERLARNDLLLRCAINDIRRRIG